MSLRRSQRFQIQGAIALSTDGGNTEAALVNLSTGGCAVESDTLFQKGEHLELRVYLPNEEPPLQVDLARVRWSSGRAYGLEFIRIRDEVKKQLRGILRAETRKRTSPTARIPQTTSAKR